MGEILEDQDSIQKDYRFYQEKNCMIMEEIFFLSISPKRRHFVRFPIPVTLERLYLWISSMA